MDVSNQRDLRDVDAAWQFTCRTVGSPPRVALARAIEQLSLSHANSPAPVHSLWDFVGHEAGECSSGLQGFTILEYAATHEDYNIIGPVDLVSPFSENESLTSAGPSARYSLRSLPDRLADDPASFHNHHGPLAVTEWPVAFAEYASPNASTFFPETNNPIGAGASVTSSVEFLTESSSSEVDSVDSFEEEQQQLPPATPELPVAIKVESGMATAAQESPKSARPLEGSGLQHLAAIDHAEPWKASQPALTHEQSAEFADLDAFPPSPEPDSLTGSEDSAASSSESLADSLSSDDDSVQGNPPLGAPELPGEFNPDTDIDTNFSHEAASEMPATPVGVVAQPSTPTASAAASVTVTASQPPPEPAIAIAPDIAGLTQTLSAESSIPAGTSSPATETSNVSAERLRLRAIVSRYLK